MTARGDGVAGYAAVLVSRPLLVEAPAARAAPPFPAGSLGPAVRRGWDGALGGENGLQHGDAGGDLFLLDCADGGSAVAEESRNLGERRGSMVRNDENRCEWSQKGSGSGCFQISC